MVRSAKVHRSGNVRVATQASVVLVLLAGVLLSGQSLIQLINVPPIVCPSAECRGLLDFTAVPVSVGPGDQYDPHISGNLISFTNGTSINYHDLFSGSTQPVPALLGDADGLSDVSGQYIMFNRWESTGRLAVEVYDTTINDQRELNVVPFPLRAFSGLGATTAAYIDFVAPQGELLVTDFGVDPEVTTRLTTDSRVDASPQVSPDGTRVVWETCATTSPLNCDIALATRGAIGVWTTVLLSFDGVHQSNPDVDGTWVVYEEVFNGARRIRMRALNGTVDQRLIMPGEQRNPAVSRGFVTFESTPVGSVESDLYLYEIATRRLWQITNTQGADESLNDISVQDDGTVGVVFTQGVPGARDVFAVRFRVPGSETASQLLRRIGNLLNSYNLLGPLLSLRPVLQDAQQAITAGDAATACIAMSTFTDRVNTLLARRQLSQRQAQDLLALATEIRQILGCP